MIQFATVCDMCGGPGLGELANVAEEWLAGADIFHVNPAVCRYYLDLRERERQERVKKAENIVQAL